MSRGNTSGGNGGLFDETTPAGMIRGVDVSESRTAAEKAAALLTAEIKSVEQAKQLQNPDARVALGGMDKNRIADQSMLMDLTDCTGDTLRFRSYFWEVTD